MSVNGSFNVCDVTLNEPWFIVNDDSGVDVLIIDNDGDAYARGEDHSLLNNDSLNSFQVDNIFLIELLQDMTI
jgi:hypothetical protein